MQISIEKKNGKKMEKKKRIKTEYEIYRDLLNRKGTDCERREEKKWYCEVHPSFFSKDGLVPFYSLAFPLNEKVL